MGQKQLDVFAEGIALSINEKLSAIYGMIVLILCIVGLTMYSIVTMRIGVFEIHEAKFISVRERIDGTHTTYRLDHKGYVEYYTVVRKKR